MFRKVVQQQGMRQSAAADICSFYRSGASQVFIRSAASGTYTVYWKRVKTQLKLRQNPAEREHAVMFSLHGDQTERRAADRSVCFSQLSVSCRLLVLFCLNQPDSMFPPPLLLVLILLNPNLRTLWDS